MALFRKKAVVVEAEQFTGKDSQDRIRTLVGGEQCSFGGPWATISMSMGSDLDVNTGDWVIRGSEGEVYAIPDRAFTRTHEVLDNELGE